ncbi:hypothetical protein M5K25_026380 [Dendrobium thyrsiflorum]|uniref:Uncharacterized protein n=1 Tax=Dendrobium thyrsiflorum TaxID=117978 RepID=A0ABD0TX98_DENTH
MPFSALRAVDLSSVQTPSGGALSLSFDGVLCEGNVNVVLESFLELLEVDSLLVEEAWLFVLLHQFFLSNLEVLQHCFFFVCDLCLLLCVLTLPENSPWIAFLLFLIPKPLQVWRCKPIPLMVDRMCDLTGLPIGSSACEERKDSTMMFSGPSITFCFGSDSRVTVPESLLSGLPAGGIPLPRGPISYMGATTADIESPLSAGPKGSGGCGIFSPSILLAALVRQVVGFTYFWLREPDRDPGRHSSPPPFSSDCLALTRWASEFRGLFICCGQADNESPLSAVPKGSGGCGSLSPSILLAALVRQVVGFTYFWLREPDRDPGRYSSPPPFSSDCLALTRWASEFRGLFICCGQADNESPLSAVPKGSGGCGSLSPSILLAALVRQADNESPLSAVPKGPGGCGSLSPSILLAALVRQVLCEGNVNVVLESFLELLEVDSLLVEEAWLFVLLHQFFLSNLEVLQHCFFFVCDLCLLLCVLTLPENSPWIAFLLFLIPKPLQCDRTLRVPRLPAASAEVFLSEVHTPVAGLLPLDGPSSESYQTRDLHPSPDFYPWTDFCRTSTRHELSSDFYPTLDLRLSPDFSLSSNFHRTSTRRCTYARRRTFVKLIPDIELKPVAGLLHVDGFSSDLYPTPDFRPSPDFCL